MKHRRRLPIASMLALVTAAAAATAGGGCASTPMAQLETPPPDFILGLTVLTPPGGGGGGSGGDAAAAGDLSPARHIMEADWVLRTAVGGGVSPEVFPARTRQLRREQVLELWGMLRASGLLSPDHPGRLGGWPAEAPPPLRTVLVVEVTADGEHRVVAVEADGEEGAGARALAERLGELAWVR